MAYDTGRSSYRQQYYHRDHLGSVRVAERYKSGGFAIAQATDYYAFGGVMPTRDVRGSIAAREGYTGHELDRATGLVYAGARYYDPVVARWTSVDPLASTMPTWSPYNYSFNSPVVYTDPDGRSPWRLLKSAANVTRRAYQASRRGESLTSLNTWKKAGADEVLAIADNVRTLIDGDINADDAFAVVDLVTGFGGEARQAARAMGVADGAGDATRGTRVDEVIQETVGGRGNITSAHTLTESEAVEAGQRFVGGNAAEIGKPGSGVFRSSSQNPDGSWNQFRIDNGSLEGNHPPNVPHVHLEQRIDGQSKSVVNNHIPIEKDND